MMSVEAYVDALHAELGVGVVGAPGGDGEAVDVAWVDALYARLVGDATTAIPAWYDSSAREHLILAGAGGGGEPTTACRGWRCCMRSGHLAADASLACFARYAAVDDAAAVLPAPAAAAGAHPPPRPPGGDAGPHPDAAVDRGLRLLEAAHTAAPVAAAVLPLPAAAAPQAPPAGRVADTGGTRAPPRPPPKRGERDVAVTKSDRTATDIGATFAGGTNEVTAVVPGGCVAEAGIPVGTRVMWVNDTRVDTAEAVRAAYAAVDAVVLTLRVVLPKGKRLGVQRAAKALAPRKALVPRRGVRAVPLAGLDPGSHVVTAFPPGGLPVGSREGAPTKPAAKKAVSYDWKPLPMRQSGERHTIAVESGAGPDIPTQAPAAAPYRGKGGKGRGGGAGTRGQKRSASAAGIPCGGDGKRVKANSKAARKAQRFALVKGGAGSDEDSSDSDDLLSRAKAMSTSPSPAPVRSVAVGHGGTPVGRDDAQRGIARLVELLPHSDPQQALELSRQSALTDLQRPQLKAVLTFYCTWPRQRTVLRSICKALFASAVTGSVLRLIDERVVTPCAEATVAAAGAKPTKAERDERDACKGRVVDSLLEAKQMNDLRPKVLLKHLVLVLSDPTQAVGKAEMAVLREILAPLFADGRLQRVLDACRANGQRKGPTR